MPIAPEIQKLIGQQIKTGALKEGEMGYIKFAKDGTAITRREVATASTITLSNDRKALQIGTVAIVMAGETYEVFTLPYVFQ